MAPVEFGFRAIFKSRTRQRPSSAIFVTFVGVEINAMNLLSRGWANFIRTFWPAAILFALVVLIVSFQIWLLPGGYVDGAYYTQYNNYVIFKQSFFHLIHLQDLYASYLHEQWDFYKYSPTFSLLFAPLAILPDIVGLIIWNGLNAFLLFLGVIYLPQFSQKSKIKILLFVLIELVTSMQNAQSNAMMVGLILLGFCYLERGHFFWGIFFIVLTVFIKVYGILALGLLLFYPNKSKLILYTSISSAVLFLLPLLAIGGAQLVFLYESWWNLLKDDHTNSFGLSVMGWLTSWFRITPPKMMVLLFGTLLLGLPLLWWRRYSMYAYRVIWLASLLIWLVIFNHKAESPTFIVAVVGVTIWYYCKPRGVVDLTLIVLVFIFTILSTTDIFPNYIQDNFFDPFAVKAVPCIVVWARISYELLFEKDFKPSIQ